jgi:hypothetical protein
VAVTRYSKDETLQSVEAEVAAVSEPAPVAVAEIAAAFRALPGAPMVGLSAHDGVVLDIVAASDVEARLAEETQLLHVTSPAREAAADKVPVLVTDLARTGCWPDCCDELRWRGVGALQCQPLARPDGKLVGVLTVYGPDRSIFTSALAAALRELYPRVIAALVAYRPPVRTRPRETTGPD